MPKTKKPNFAKASLGKLTKKSSSTRRKKPTSPIKKSHKKKKLLLFERSRELLNRLLDSPASPRLHGITRRIKKTSSRFSLRTKILLGLGILLFGISFLWHMNQTIQLAFFTPRVTASVSSGPAPISLQIKRVSLSLPVEQTAITGGVWGVSQKGASYLGTSARPGENGPIILYSHNTDERFGPIRWLMPGDEIVLTTLDNKSHYYTVKNMMTVSPTQIEAVTNHNSETLVLYTCDGFADLQRFVVIAEPAT